MWLMPQRPNQDPSASCWSISQRTPCRAAGVSPQAEQAEHLKGVPRHVGARLVDHLAEVEERQLAHERARVVGVERAPGAARALHAFDPAERSVEGAIGSGGAAGWAFVAHGPMQREHDLGGVIDVGIVDVGELERPAAGVKSGSATTSRPDGDLLAEQPFGGPHHRRVVAGNARRR